MIDEDYEGRWDENVSEHWIAVQIQETAPNSKSPKAQRMISLAGWCRAYSSGTHARKDEDGLLLEFPCNPTRTCTV
jgi:hypothetical protein